MERILNRMAKCLDKVNRNSENNKKGLEFLKGQADWRGISLGQEMPVRDTGGLKQMWGDV